MTNSTSVTQFKNLPTELRNLIVDQIVDDRNFDSMRLSYKDLKNLFLALSLTHDNPQFRATCEHIKKRISELKPLIFEPELSAKYRVFLRPTTAEAAYLASRSQLPVPTVRTEQGPNWFINFANRQISELSKDAAFPIRIFKSHLRAAQPHKDLDVLDQLTAALSVGSRRASTTNILPQHLQGSFNPTVQNDLMKIIALAKKIINKTPEELYLQNNTQMVLSTEPGSLIRNQEDAELYLRIATKAHPLYLACCQEQIPLVIIEELLKTGARIPQEHIENLVDDLVDSKIPPERIQAIIGLINQYSV